MEGNDHQRSSGQIKISRTGDADIVVEAAQGGPVGSSSAQEIFYDGTTAIRGASNDHEGKEQKGLDHVPLLHHQCELKSIRVVLQHNLGDEARQSGIDNHGPGHDGSLKAQTSDNEQSGDSWVCESIQVGLQHNLGDEARQSGIDNHGPGHDGSLKAQTSDNEQSGDSSVCGPRQRLTPPCKVGDKIELLCQDSGIRGCWYRCTVLKSSQKRFKVRYDDLLNEDESKNLEEWVPAFSPATSDKLGMRCPGRLTIRPSPTHNYLPDDVAFQIGSPVDLWWNDGWWEGVVIGVKSSGDDNVHVYLPGEGKFQECQRRDLRISRDWLSNEWVDVDVKQNILSAISMVGSGSESAKGPETGSSAMFDHGIRAVEADGKTSAILSSESYKFPDNVERADPRKWCRDDCEDANEACDDGDS